MSLPLPNPDYAGTTINGIRTASPQISDDWETLSSPPATLAPASIISFSCDHLLSTVTYTFESKYGCIQRDASEIQILLDNLIQRYPTTLLPTLPQREWENQIRSIGETVQEFGVTVLYTTTTAGVQLVNNVTTYVGGEEENQTGETSENGRRYLENSTASLTTTSATDEETKETQATQATQETQETQETKEQKPTNTSTPTLSTDTTALVPPPFPAPDDHVSAYEEHMNIMVAGLNSFMCSLASIHHIWSSNLVQIFLGASINTTREKILAEHFLLQPLPSVQVEIGRGDNFELAIVIDEDDGCVIWDFYVEENDIGFEVCFQPHNDEDEDEDEPFETKNPFKSKPKLKPDNDNDNDNDNEMKAKNASDMKDDDGIVCHYVRYPTESCNASKHVVGRYEPGIAGTVLLKWDNTNSLVRTRSLHRIVEVVDRNMLDAATRAAEDEERIGRIQREEKIRDQETRKAMAMTGGTMVLPRDNNYDENFQLLQKRLETMEDMIGSMTAKRDQATALLMMERQTRTETELLLRDTHHRLETLRVERSHSRTKTTSLQEEVDKTKADLLQSTSLATAKGIRLQNTEKELIQIRREHDSLLDEKRAWSFSKLDLDARAEEAQLVTHLREQVADAEDNSSRAVKECDEAKEMQRELQKQVIQLKVLKKTKDNEYLINNAALVKSLATEREKVIDLNNKIRELTSQVSKYKTHKRVLVQELRTRRKEQRSRNGGKDGKDGNDGNDGNGSDLLEGNLRSLSMLSNASISSISSNASSSTGSTGRNVDNKGNVSSHTIVKKDDYNTLSLQYDMSISDIKKLNNLFGQNHLPPIGTVLQVTPGSRTISLRERQLKQTAQEEENVVQVRGWEK